LADAPPPSGIPPHAPRRPNSEGFRRFIERAPESTAGRVLLGSASIVAAGFILSRLLGLVRSVVIAHAFGTDPELASFWVASRLPDLVFQLLAGATLSAAFIPTFSRVMLRQGEDSAWRLASSALNIIAVATLVLAALAFVFAPTIVPWLAPGLGEATGQHEELRALAVRLTRLMLISPLFFGVSGMLTGILNARHHFLAPALAPVCYNLGIIVGAVFFADHGVDGLAWGVVGGAAAHLLVQVPALRSAGMRWSPSFEVFSEGVQEVLRLMGPRVLGLGASQLNFLAAIFFASFVSDEAISALNYAFLMMMMPVGVIGMAISTAVFPTLAQHGASQDTSALRVAVSKALRQILFLAVPASVGLIILATPSVRALLERGAFDVGSTELVVAALTLYAAGIAAHSGIEILSRGFYAVSDTRTPVAIAVAAMLLNLALSAALVAPFGLRGLAGAASITAFVEFGLLLWVLSTRLGGLERRALTRTVGSTLAATTALSAVMVAALFGLTTAGVEGDTTLGSLVRIAVAGTLGLVAFGVAGYLANRDDLRMVARQ
jgi:putative peptidoglycan lipid II flippase